MGDCSGLSRAGSCKQTHGAEQRFGRLALAIIKGVKKLICV
jgi:hypothetical protein